MRAQVLDRGQAGGVIAVAGTGGQVVVASRIAQHEVEEIQRVNGLLLLRELLELRVAGDIKARLGQREVGEICRAIGSTWDSRSQKSAI